MLAAEGLGDRVVHRCGDVTRDDLGEGRWDVVFASHLVHHFDEATNRALARRVERSLRPGGVFVVQELAHDPLLDLYFAVTSSAGTWRFEDIAAWQREARLVPLRVARFVSMPLGGQQSAVKPAS